MPIYEYICNDCQSGCELLVRGDEQIECPACNSKKLEKVLSVIAAPSVKSTSSGSSAEPMPQAGCGLPQCGQGRCGGSFD